MIGFFARGKLKKISVSGGAPQILCHAPRGIGGSWNQDDTIIFTLGIFTGCIGFELLGATRSKSPSPPMARTPTAGRFFFPMGNIMYT